MGHLGLGRVRKDVGRKLLAKELGKRMKELAPGLKFRVFGKISKNILLFECDFRVGKLF